MSKDKSSYNHRKRIFKSVKDKVMQEIKKNRTKLVTLRLTPEEYKYINSRFKATTCRKLSDYLRKVLLAGKVTVLTRSKSLDDFMTEMIELRKQLNAVGNNFNQMVRKLHTVTNAQEVRSWILLAEATQTSVIKRIEEIKNRINQFAEKW